MDAQIISALVEGGLGIFGIAVLGWLFWKIVGLLMKNFLVAIKEINDTSKDNVSRQVNALNELAASINSLRDGQGGICKANDSLGKRDSEGRKAKRQDQSRSGQGD